MMDKRMQKSILKPTLIVLVFVLSALSLIMAIPRSSQAQVPAGCPSNITHYWQLDEMTGSPYIDFYGTNDAACANCPTPTTGIINNAQQFDGIDDEVNVTDDNTFDWGVTDSFSIEFWMKTPSASTCSGNQVIVGRDDASSQLHWWVGCYDGGKGAFNLIDNGGNIASLAGLTDLTDGSWHHIVAVRDASASEIRIYVDGTLEGSTPSTYSQGFDSQTADLNIGWLNLSHGFHFEGTVDEIALYNRVLSDVEIKQHFYDGFVGLRLGYCVDCNFPIGIMPLGDSITWGYGVTMTDNNYIVGYRQKLNLDLIGAGYNVDFVGGLQSGALANPSFDIDHEGHGGWHAKGGTGGGLAPNIYNWLAANPADVILLHIGTNDISAGGQDAIEVSEILDEIDRYSQDITVILARIINEVPYNPTVTQFNNDVEAMAMNRIVNGDKIMIVDQEGALNYIDDMDDAHHPNMIGYDKMADVWLNALNDFLPVCVQITPSIISVPVTQAKAGWPYAYDIDATGNPAPTYSLVTAPSGMSINPTTGLIEWTPQASGDFNVVVQASNSVGYDTQSFTISVITPPPCPSNISHYWTLDEITGSPYKDVSGNNDATCINCPTAATGAINGAQQFDGIDDEVNVADDNTFDWGVTDSFSIEFWMKTDSASICSGNQVIVGRDNASSQLHWWVGCYNEGLPAFVLVDTDGGADQVLLTGLTDLTEGFWHHIVAVRDASTNKISLYVDGIEESSAISAYSSGFDSQSAPLNIGWLNLWPGFHFEGIVDEVALYNRALSDTEVLQHYNDGLGGYGYCNATYTITATVPGGNGTISCDPATVNHGDSSTCTLTPSTGYHLQSLTDNTMDVTGLVSGDIYTASNVTEGHIIEASFAINTYTLTVGKDGTGTGTVTSSPVGIDCGIDCSEAYPHGTNVTLTAAPDSGFAFTGWSGSGCSGTGQCVVAMNAGTAVTATFNDLTPPTGSMTINSDSAFTNSTAVTLNLSATDISGVAEMQFSNDNINWTAPEVYAATKLWTLTPGDGEKTVYVKFKDTVGNWSGAFSDSILLDTLAPPVDIDAVTTPTNIASQTVSGTMESGAAVSVSVDTTATVGVVSYPTATIWSCMITGLVEGTNNIAVTATDAANNTTTATTGITYDSTAPAVNIGAVTTPTNIASQTVMGTMESGATISVSIDTAATVGVVSYPTATTWSFTVTGLIEGANNITVTATDAAGNMSTTAAVIILDTILPTVSISSPAAGITNDNTPLLIYTVSDGTVTVKVDGSIVAKVSGDSLDILADGLHTVSVESADAAGNTGFAEVSFTVEATAPVTTASPAGNVYASGQSVTLTCYDSTGSGCDKTYYCLGNACNDPTAYTTYSGGTVEITSSSELRFYSTDIAGNVEALNIEKYTIAALGCSDAGIIECLERTDGGNDGDNLDPVSGKPKADVKYDFKLVVRDTGGPPQYVRLYMTQRNNPFPSDFYAHDMTCSGTSDSCTYSTKLGPAAVHRYYFELGTSDGETLRHPPGAGYLTGPVVQMLTGYNLVSVPRDINAANLNGFAAFDSSRAYRWDPVLGYYTPVTSAEPARTGEGYFVFNEKITLPELGNYGEVQAFEHTYRLEPGWNLISNPYGGNVRLENIKVVKGTGAPVAWTGAVTNGWLVNAIYYFQGSDWGGTYAFETAPEAALVPWMGYWVYLNMADDTYYLVIPKP